MGFAAEVEVMTSPEYKVMGAIGACSSLKKKNRSVADSEIGEGGTYAWRMGGLRPESTIAIFFEISRFFIFSNVYRHAVDLHAHVLAVACPKEIFR